MSLSKASLTPIQRAAFKIVQAEMRSYDALSRPARIVYERAVTRAIDSGTLNASYTCAHGVMLYDPCDKCERSEEECEVYQRAALSKMKELLSILG